MPKYALDTNLYIDASRLPERMATLRQFVDRNLPQIHLSAVVAHELIQGARTPSQLRVVEEEVLAPFARVSRTFAPSTRAWHEAGVAMARLQQVQGTLSPSLRLDLLLAISCREQGITLVSRDGDFEEIRDLVPGLEAVGAFPAVRG